MSQLKRYMAKALLILLLFSSTTVSPGYFMQSIAIAAVKAPTVVTSKKVLYLGADTYKVEIKNLSSKAIVTYQSSNTRVATVSKAGKVKPLKAGAATITVTIKQNGKTYRLKTEVTVKKPTIEFTSSIDYLNVGEAYLLKAKTNGMKEKVVWSVSDDTIASISAGGKLTALSAGEVTVTATAGGIKKQGEISIGTNRLGVFSNQITCYEPSTVYVHIYEPIKDEVLTADTLSKSNAVIDFEWDKQTEANILPITILPKKAGKETLILTSDKATDRLYIDITVTEKPKDRLELNAKEVYAKCSPATVIITATNKSGAVYTGSGFFIDNGLLVTNYHVIEGSSRIIVRTQEEKEYEVKEIVGFDAKIDLAILRVNSQNPSLVLNQDGAVTGEEIYALGSPLGLTGTLSDGMVSTSSRVIEGVDYIQITAPISPGNSGGPLLNGYGEVLGVNTMYLVNGQNLNFAVNIKELQKISTNRPMSMKEFGEQYQLIQKDKDTQVIYEDSTKSGDPMTCQEIAPMVYVEGAITADEYWDCYSFKVEEPVYVIGAMGLKNKELMKDIRFHLYDYDLEYPIAYGENQIYNGDPMKVIQAFYLEPGEYFISIWLPDEYVGEDVPYMFMIDLLY